MKRAWNLAPVLQIIQSFQKNFALVYIYQLTWFDGLMTLVQKVYSKMHPVSYTNARHGVIGLIIHGMVKNTKI